MKLLKAFLVLFSFVLISCDGAVNTPKWAYQLASEKVDSLYNVLDIEAYSANYVSKATRSFRVEINHRSRSVGGAYYWYEDICTVPFDASSYLSVSCY